MSKLRGLILENFRSFQARTFVPLAPITILVGENSSGKSALMSSLLLLKQSLSGVSVGEEHLASQGDLVDLGNSQMLVYGHDADRVCEIAVFLEPGPDIPLGYSSLNRIEDSSLGLGARFKAVDEVGGSGIWVEGFNLYATSSKPFVVLERDVTAKASCWAGPSQIPFLTIKGDLPAFVMTKVDEMNADLRLLYKWRTEILRRVVQALREWPKQDSIRTWDLYATNDDRAKYPDAECAQDYLARLRESGCDLGILADHLVELCSWSVFMREVSETTHRIYTVRGIHPFPSEGPLAAVDLPGDVKAPGPETAPIPEASRWVDTDYTTCLLFEARGLASLVDGEAVPLSPNLSTEVDKWNKAFQEVMSDMIFLGPLRAAPQRFYAGSSLTHRTMVSEAIGLPQRLLNAESDLAQVNEYLRVFETGHQVEPIRIVVPDVGDVLVLRLLDSMTKVPVALCDVGFGISQVLPVITECLGSRNTLILMQQPELHLHPRLQAELGSLFAKCVKEPYKNQLVVETHSEYLIHRLQRLIRRGDLSPEDVSVLYVLRDEEGSHVLTLRLDEKGEFLDQWPDGFFDTSYEELFGD